MKCLHLEPSIVSLHKAALQNGGEGCTPSYKPTACYRHRYLSTVLGDLLGIQRDALCKDMLGRC